MKTKLLMTMLILAICPGCAAWIASIDVDEAIKVAATVNLVNVETATADKIAVHDVGLGKLETSFETMLANSADGKAALIVYVAYKKKLAELQTAKQRDLNEYAKALDNALLLVELIERRIGLRAGWDAMIGRLPGIGQLRTLAEIEARKYVNELQALKEQSP